MTTFKKGDMWTRFGEVDLFCITINGTFKFNGSLVMDAGIAKQARDEIPNIEQVAGAQLKTYFVQAPCELPAFYLDSMKQTVGLFQTKHHFGGPASIELIKRSAIQLFKYITSYPKMTVCLNFPGIGYRGIDRSEVLPIVNLFPGNVEVWER